MPKTVSLKELRPNLPKFVDEVDKRMERITVTRRGRPVAVLISPDDLEGLLETIEILNDKPLMSRIRKAELDFKKGKGIPLEEIHRKLGL